MEAASKLVADGADLSYRMNGKTPLHFAAIEGFAEICEVMVAKGADLEARDEQRGTTGWTPLIWAAMQGHAKTCEALLSLGADISAADASGTTALSLAEAYERVEAADVLKKWLQKTT
eukprot:TRINITY_DN35394_c0_g1_i1.p4 TRINITY_DN35394_c0_g1~~TRINITY_DN35394_c0_g1_i1.p4  ORF type:complete len:118 (-),score=41.89 TRINITY_DN35394_c0_g1_i1:410-763(-)